ncbi:MAG: DNA topoisomerase 1 [Candidatus Dojkabacteria bacterium]|nr:MAG: DNA topoisomerase 1 [Candidatus Dojkabacteria bacterium]
MNLVIVESPSKAKTISRYLGKDYKVIASKGHVVDLPKSSLGIDIENNFEPQYEVTKPAVLKNIKKELKNCDTVVLAVDLDREGEAIGWHIANKLNVIDKNAKPKGSKKILRIVFSEISKQALQNALKNPRGINMNLVNAQQARRVLDRLVGYKLSPLLWKKIQFGLSAGRVQSVALRLIVEKEEEREAFVAEEFWNINVYAQTKKHNKSIKTDIVLADNKVAPNDDTSNLINFSLTKYKNKKIKIENESQAKEILNSINQKVWEISEVNKTETLKKPSPPLITSTLQRVAVNKFGYSAKKTMNIAQKLYENGFITYMRTDSTHMSSDAITKARSYIQKSFGEKYLNEKVRSFKANSKNAQEAHECIRPVDFKLTPKDLNLDQEYKNIYKIIWSYALASQMAPAKIENIKVKTLISDYEFEALGSRIIFDGYLKVVETNFSEKNLPDLKESQEIYPVLLHAQQKFTTPPARYTEATLIKKLEELGIGRPSTYASIISTILSRKYVEKIDRYLAPTDMGRVVNALLTKYFQEIVDYNFTAEMEESLDLIANGEKDWKEMIKNFYFPFEKKLSENEKLITRDEFKIFGKADESIKCPKCSKQMVIKLGKNGRFLSCVDFPDCDGIRSIDGKTQKEIENESQSEEFKQTYKPAPQTEDGRSYVLKEGRYGKFWAHPDYPKVKDARPLEFTDEKIKEIYGDPPKTDDGRLYILKKGRFGEFWAHPDYPKVKDIKKINKK